MSNEEEKSESAYKEEEECPRVDCNCRHGICLRAVIEACEPENNEPVSALQDQNKLLNSQVIKDFIAQNKITELESEIKALQEKLKVSDHLKELADDAIVTLQKENEELKNAIRTALFG